MVRARFAFFLLLSVATVRADDVLPAHCAILPLSEAKKLVAQCSRDCPYYATEFWIPTTSQILAIESRLPSILRGSGHKVKASSSLHQYVGFIAKGKRLIYLSAVDSSDIPKKDKSWRHEALVVCDGGDAFWGVEFDPATGKFAHLEFNGAI